MKFETSPASREASQTSDNTAEPGQNPIRALEKWVSYAASKGIQNYNACALSTVSEDGSPTNRIVLIREVTENDELVFYTHRPSPKVAALTATPRCAGVFYWDELLRQVRFRGTANLLDREFVERYFWSRPREAQIAAHVSQQSEVLRSRQDLEQNFEEALTRFDGPVPCPEGFVGFVITIQELEFWSQGEHRLHHRTRFLKTAETWQRDLLYP